MGCPGRTRLGFWLSAVENIVQIGKQSSGMAIAGDQKFDNLVRDSIGVTPGTNPHADVTVGADLAPVIEASFGIELPPLDTVG